MAVDAGLVIEEQKQEKRERVASDEKNTIKEMYKIMDKDMLLLTDEDFALPSMGDIYINAVDNSALEKFKEEMEGKNAEGSLNDTAFYIDKPYSSEFGVFEDDAVIFLKGKAPSTTDLDRLEGNYDGDTLYFNVSELVGDPDGKAVQEITDRIDNAVSILSDAVGTGEFATVDEILKESGKTVKTAAAYKRAASELNFGVRFLGYNAPEVVKWKPIGNYSEKDFKVEKRKYGEIKDDPDHYFIDRHDERKDSDVVELLSPKLNDKGFMQWTEVATKKVDGKNQRMYLFKSEETNKERREAGKKAQALVKEALSKSIDGYVYLMLNTSKISMKSQRYGSKFDGVTAISKSLTGKTMYIWSQLMDYQDYTYQGYTAWGVDTYARYLGTPYVLTEEGYINITKYVIAGEKSALGDVFPDYGDTAIDVKNNQNLDKYFNMASYDYDRFQVYDLEKSAGDYIDDRIKVQREIFGKSFDDLREWTVGIGDTFFMVPPTSIRVSNEVSHERIRTMRSRGSAVKGGTKVDKYIEMDIYFNGERGINGVPWTTKLPNGQKITYYMNGLRALIAQFKFCPFLPIESRYINQVCNVEAVNLVSLQVSSVEGFPRTYVARVVLQAFDWMTYMPDLPANVKIDEHQDEDEYFNTFAKAIDYQSMRWYYQRAIRTGEKVVGMDSVSKKYIKETLGNNTALQPMQFESSDVTFYVANEARLQKMMQAKIQALDTSKTYPVISDYEKKIIKDLSKLGKKINDGLGDESVKRKIEVAQNEWMRLTKAEYDDTGKLESKKNDVGISVPDGNKDKTIKKSLNVTDLNTFTYKKNEELSESGAMGTALDDIQDAVVDSIKDSTGDVKMVTGVSPIYRLSNSGLYVGARIEIDTGIQSDSQITNLLSSAASASSGNENTYSPKSYHLSDGYLDVFYQIPFGEEVKVDQSVAAKAIRTIGWDWLANIAAGRLNGDGIKSYSLDSINEAKVASGKNFPDIDLLNYAIAYQDIINGDTSNNEIADNTQTLDYISPYTLNYDKYEIGHVAIQDIAISMSNTFMKYGLNGQEGYASQYMGSDDAVIEITMHSTDEYAVGMINQMTSTQSRYARDYRLILPACPFRIDSEVTRMMGINEILIEKVNIDTVPGVPGLYNITISAISMDRTLRSREALNKINDWENNGSVKNSAAQKIKVKTYDSLRESLAAAEVYPDLELPTIEELESKGFNFLRHVFDKERTYPDPDFYFVYGYQLQSDVFRKAVANAIDQKTSSSVWVDETGGSLTLEDNTEMVYKGTDSNGATKELDDLVAKQVKAKSKVKTSKEYVSNATSLISIMQSAENVEGWKVSDNIRVLGMDKYHQELLRQDASIVKKKTGEARQGKWLSDQMEGPRKASKLIKKALDKKMPTGDVVDRRKDKEYTSAFNEMVCKYIYDNFGEALKLLNFSEKEIRPTDGILWNSLGSAFSEFTAMIKCVGAAVSAKKEESKSSGESSNTRFDYLGISTDTSMNSSGKRRSVSLEDVKENGIKFSIFGLEMLKPNAIKKLNVYGEVPEGNPDKPGTNYQYVCLDPAYRKANLYTDEAEMNALKEYKECCAKDYYFAAKAFSRIVMLFLAKSIDEYVFPNVQFDLMGSDLKSLMNDLGGSEKDGELEKEINDYADFLETEDRPINVGKLFICLLSAATSSDKPIEFIRQGRYDEFNSMVTNAASASGENISDDPETVFYRRFLKKMPYYKLAELDSIGNDDSNDVASRRKEYRERVFLDAVKDPSLYITHSFHDMVVNDMRGRMARAFPTFYMLLVDEGRRIGMWKLHDNFYNINSISEIAVTKSRKNPADTCKITMSNMFMTYTTDDEDIKTNYEYDYKDVWNSIFHPTAIYEKEEARRMNAQPMNKAKLVPGIRMHVRMGYNGNAANLPIMFNGVIAEVSAGETVEIVGQGDGTELLNPITKTDSKQLDEGTVSKKLGSKFNSSQTPYEIFERLLCNRGDLVERKIDEWSNGYYRSYNEYGIVHFGDPRYNLMFDAGEPIQNIFEAVTKPVWYKKDTKSELYGMEEPPEIAIKTLGKTAWDVMNIAASLSPDFVLGIAPFGMRSTVFHGHPRYYYAYDYQKDPKTGEYVEKRKPFQQYHIVTSYTDIIQNNITASANNGMATNAQGIFKTKGLFGGSKEGYTGRLYADWDIYPEYQKSIVYDTGIEYRGSEILGKIPLIHRAETALKNTMETETSGKEKAWRATAKALKLAMHDMYTGNILLTGNPSIKPHDRIELYDTYENIVGPVLVESVTHIMSPDTGFTTDIVPDCIAVVDDRFETVTQQRIKECVLPAIMYGVTTSSIAATLNKLSPTLSLASAFVESKKKQINKVASVTDKVIKDIDDAQNNEMVKTRKSIKKGLQMIMDSTSGDKLLKFVKGSGTVFGIASLANPMFWAAMAVEAFVFYSISTTVNNKLQHAMRNKQVLEIYPVKKNSKVLTAGLTGNMGSVVGSPTEGMKGVWEKVASYVTGGENDSSGSKIATFISGILLNDETTEYFERVSKRSVSDDSPTVDGSEEARQRVVNNVMTTLSQEEMIKVSALSTLLTTPRIAPAKNASETQKAEYETKKRKRYEELKIGSIDDLGNNKRVIEDLQYVLSNKIIKTAFEERYLRLIWQEQYNKKSAYEQITFNVPGQDPITTKVSVRKKKTGDTVYDIPFLAPDAMKLLEEVVKIASNHLTSDEKEKGETEENFIILSSATICGKEPSLAATGLSFRIDASGKDGKAVIAQIKEELENTKKALIEAGLPETYIGFKYVTPSKSITGDGKSHSIRFTVYPRA